MSKREFTKKETEWINSFKRILYKMPKTLEISADYGHTNIYNAGARAKSFAEIGDGDNIENFSDCCCIIPNSPITPNGESL